MIATMAAVLRRWRPRRRPRPSRSSSCSGGDPITTWPCREPASPGGNITGMSTFIAEIEPKRLELLRELVPMPRRLLSSREPRHIQQAEIQVSDIRRPPPAASGCRLTGPECQHHSRHRCGLCDAGPNAGRCALGRAPIRSSSPRAEQLVAAGGSPCDSHDVLST